jgi:hypothetical protein
VVQVALKRYSWFETYGHAQLTLYQTGAFTISSSLTDPSAWDYESISLGRCEQERHTASLQSHRQHARSGDRWIEGGSEIHRWNSTGTNDPLKAG